jgi:hypothetical protein
MANFRLEMTSGVPSITRTYYTTFSYEMMLDALREEGIDFKEGEKGRIFFRLAHFPQTLIELCRGGTLMLKGSFDFDLQDDRLIAELFKIQCKHFPPPIVISYKLSSFHASRRWLKATLARCIEILTNETYSVRNEFADRILENLWLLANKGKSAKDQLEDEIVEFKRRRLQQSLKLLLTGGKETEFTPFPFSDVIGFGKYCMAFLDPTLKSNITTRGAQEITYLFSPRSPDVKVIQR